MCFMLVVCHVCFICFITYNTFYTHIRYILYVSYVFTCYIYMCVLISLFFYLFYVICSMFYVCVIIVKRIFKQTQYIRICRPPCRAGHHPAAFLTNTPATMASLWRKRTRPPGANPAALFWEDASTPGGDSQRSLGLTLCTFPSAVCTRHQPLRLAKRVPAKRTPPTQTWVPPTAGAGAACTTGCCAGGDHSAHSSGKHIGNVSGALSAFLSGGKPCGKGAVDSNRGHLRSLPCAGADPLVGEAVRPAVGERDALQHGVAAPARAPEVINDSSP